MNRMTAPPFLAVGALLLLGACSKAPSPGEAQANIANATAEGQRDIAKAQSKADDKMAVASDDVNAARRDAGQVAATSTRAVRVAEAEAAHKVAIERCESQIGDARAACKNVADTELAAAKARADAAEIANSPKT